MSGAVRGLRINVLLPMLNPSGGIKANRIFADELTRRGHDVRLIFCRFKDPWPKPWRVRSFARRGLSEIRTLGEAEDPLEGTLARLFPVYRNVIQPADVPDGDVVIGTWWKTMEWVHNMPPSKGVRVHFVHGHETYGAHAERVEEVYRLPHAKVAVSGWLAEVMRERYGASSVRVVPNGLTRSRFDGSPRKRGEPPTVGFVYGNIAVKGPEVALEALRLVQEAMPEVRLLGFGHSPISSDHKKPARLEYIVNPSQAVIPSLYRRADCWMVSSTSEGFGLPGAEAMASACPVVSTRCGGPSEYLRDGVNGYFVDVGDAGGLAARVLDVLRCEPEAWERMSAAAAATGGALDWSVSAAELERSLVGVLREHDYVVDDGEGSPPRVVSGPERRILRVNFVLPVPSLSGGVKSNRLIAEALVRRGHDVRIVFPFEAPRWPKVWRVRSLARRIHEEVVTLHKPRHHLMTSTARLIQRPGRKLDAADLPEADVTIGTWWETMEWLTKPGASVGKLAYFVRGYETFGGPVDRVDATYRLPVQKLAISKWLQRLMRERFGDGEAVLVPNGVDRRVFHSSPRGKQVTPTVGFQYARVAFKGIESAVGAVEELQRRMPEVRVKLFGSEGMAPEHQRRMRNLQFAHRPSAERIASIYRSCDVWMVSSVEEGFGMPGLEAAACRCPVVSTRCGGPEDYVEEGFSGHLVGVGDAAGLADAMARVLALDDAAWRKMSERSHAISRRFDWDASAEVLERVLLGMVEGKVAGGERSGA
jgi:glycosyltransferase involved in cell wall biosynthesis